ncbi:MAG: hypothetical protein MJB14_04660 [Spirochaetes bacterium]|nr:hypothetical protein [Spirochaetota bacterium]
MPEKKLAIFRIIRYYSKVKNFKEGSKYFLIFYILTVFVLITYNLSFYMSDLLYLLKNWMKIIFILIFAAGVSLYFTTYILHQVKSARIIFFIAGLLAIFFLHEYPRDILRSRFVNINTFYRILKTLSGFLALLLVYVADIFQVTKMRKRS